MEPPRRSHNVRDSMGKRPGGAGPRHGTGPAVPVVVGQPACRSSTATGLASTVCSRHDTSPKPPARIRSSRQHRPASRTPGHGWHRQADELQPPGRDRRSAGTRWNSHRVMQATAMTPGHDAAIAGIRPEQGYEEQRGPGDGAIVPTEASPAEPGSCDPDEALHRSRADCNARSRERRAPAAAREGMPAADRPRRGPQPRPGRRGNCRWPRRWPPPRPSSSVAGPGSADARPSAAFAAPAKSRSELACSTAVSVALRPGDPPLFVGEMRSRAARLNLIISGMNCGSDGFIPSSSVSISLTSVSCPAPPAASGSPSGGFLLGRRPEIFLLGRPRAVTRR